MPTNSDYDGFFTGIAGVPLFTYGMILTTSVVLAYMTIMEPDLPSTDEVVEEVVEATNANNPFMTPAAVPLPESTPVEGQEPIEGEGEEQQPVENEGIPQPSVEEEPQPPQSTSVGGVGTRKRNTKRRRPKPHN